MTDSLQEDDPVEVSIVVPAYNQAKKLRCLLASIEHLSPEPRFEAIVVNDGSTDATGDVMRAWMASSHPFPVQYIELERNSGPAAARNAGVRKARAPLVAFTDSDCRVMSDWLHCLLARFDPDKNIVGVGGIVFPVNPKGVISTYNTITGVLDADAGLHFLITCNCCYSRAALLSVGGFDEDVLTPGGEDIAASMKLILAGGKLALASDAAVYHDYRESLRSLIKTWKNYAYGNGYVVGKQFRGTPVDDREPWHTNTVRPVRPTPFYIGLAIYREWQRTRIFGMPLHTTLVCLAIRVLLLFVHYEWFRRGEAHFVPRGPVYDHAARIGRAVARPFRIALRLPEDSKRRVRE